MERSADEARGTRPESGSTVTPSPAPPDWRIARSELPRRALVFSVVALALAVAGTLFVPAFFRGFPGTAGSLLLFPVFLLVYHRVGKHAGLGVGFLMIVLWCLDAVPRVSALPLPDSTIVFVSAVGAAGVGIVAWGARLTFDRKLDEAVESMALDPETKLPRAWLVEWHLQTASSAGERGESVSVVLLEVEERGRDGQRHSLDEVRWFQVKVGELLRLESRAEDILGRLEEHRYLVVLRGESEEGAVTAAERLSGLARKIESRGGRRPQVSAGVASYASAADRGRSLRDAAERALHSALYGGGNRTVVFGSEKFKEIRESGP